MFRPSSRFPRLLLAAAGPNSSNKLKNPYETLGLDANSNPNEKEIKKAHRALAMKFHPDNKDTGNEEKFKDVQSAFDTLKANGWKISVAGGSMPDGSEPPPAGSADPNEPGSYGRNWNPPGSTKENYVQNNGRLQAAVRLVVVWCVAFSFLRYVLSNAFPDLKGRKAAQDLMLRQLEEYEQTRRAKQEGHLGANKHQSQQSQQQQIDSEAEKMLGNLVSGWGGDQPKPQRVVVNAVGFGDANSSGGSNANDDVNNNSNNNSNADDFVGWGDLGKKAKQQQQQSSSWPRPDYDPLARR